MTYRRASVLVFVAVLLLTAVVVWLGRGWIEGPALAYISAQWGIELASPLPLYGVLAMAFLLLFGAITSLISPYTDVVNWVVSLFPGKEGERPRCVDRLWGIGFLVHLVFDVEEGEFELETGDEGWEDLLPDLFFGVAIAFFVEEFAVGGDGEDALDVLF